MANIKFSQFTGGANADADSRIVGFQNGGTTNNFWTPSELANALSSHLSSIYTADGSLTAARTVTMGTYNLDFASATKGQQVSFGQNVKITGQGYTEQHDQGGITIDWDNSNVIYATLVSGSQTFTPNNPENGATYILYLRQPASGAAGTVDWNGLVLWSGGTAPTLTATNGATDIITLIYNGTNTKYFGTSVLNFS